MGHRSFETAVLRFSPTLQAERTLNFYQKLLNKHQKMLQGREAWRFKRLEARRLESYKAARTLRLKAGKLKVPNLDVGSSVPTSRLASPISNLNRHCEWINPIAGFKVICNLFVIWDDPSIPRWGDGSFTRGRKSQWPQISRKIESSRYLNSWKNMKNIWKKHWLTHVIPE